VAYGKSIGIDEIAAQDWRYRWCLFLAGGVAAIRDVKREILADRSKWKSWWKFW
jgi:hypothetical protein